MLSLFNSTQSKFQLYSLGQNDKNKVEMSWLKLFYNLEIKVEMTTLNSLDNNTHTVSIKFAVSSHWNITVHLKTVVSTLATSATVSCTCGCWGADFSPGTIKKSN